MEDANEAIYAVLPWLRPSTTCRVGRSPTEGVARGGAAGHRPACGVHPCPPGLDDERAGRSTDPDAGRRSLAAHMPWLSPAPTGGAAPSTCGCHGLGSEIQDSGDPGTPVACDVRAQDHDRDDASPLSGSREASTPRPADLGDGTSAGPTGGRPERHHAAPSGTNFGSDLPGGGGGFVIDVPPLHWSAPAPPLSRSRGRLPLPALWTCDGIRELLLRRGENRGYLSFGLGSARLDRPLVDVICHYVSDYVEALERAQPRTAQEAADVFGAYPMSRSASGGRRTFGAGWPSSAQAPAPAGQLGVAATRGTWLRVRSNFAILRRINVDDQRIGASDLQADFLGLHIRAAVSGFPLLRTWEDDYLDRGDIEHHLGWRYTTGREGDVLRAAADWIDGDAGQRIHYIVRERVTMAGGVEAGGVTFPDQRTTTFAFEPDEADTLRRLRNQVAGDWLWDHGSPPGAPRVPPAEFVESLQDLAFALARGAGGVVHELLHVVSSEEFGRGTGGDHKTGCYGPDRDLDVVKAWRFPADYEAGASRRTADKASGHYLVYLVADWFRSLMGRDLGRFQLLAGRRCCKCAGAGGQSSSRFQPGYGGWDSEGSCHNVPAAWALANAACGGSPEVVDPGPVTTFGPADPVPRRPFGQAT